MSGCQGPALPMATGPDCQPGTPGKALPTLQQGRPLPAPLPGAQMLRGGLSEKRLPGVGWAPTLSLGILPAPLLSIPALSHL